MTSIGPSHSRNFFGIFFGDGSQRMKNIDGLLKVSNRPRGTLVYSFHLAWNQRVHLLNNMLRIGFLSQMALCQPIQEYYFDMARRATVPS